MPAGKGKGQSALLRKLAKQKKLKQQQAEADLKAGGATDVAAKAGAAGAVAFANVKKPGGKSTKGAAQLKKQAKKNMQKKLLEKERAAKAAAAEAGTPIACWACGADATSFCLYIFLFADSASFRCCS